MIDRVGVVLIGRNEGERLLAALGSVPSQVAAIVYVDSGSTDGSIEAAKKAGAEVVLLDTSTPFTAARARNAGVERLRSLGLETLDYIQFIDGDCALQDGWLGMATDFLSTHSDVAVVCGRRRERFPDASVYNRLIDLEWDTPIGEARACGGDALMRRDAFDAAKGYCPDLIAGEEPELCVRLRQMGWKVWRLDAEMTRHDAALTRFGQWWQRSKRAGHAFAEGAYRHGARPELHFVSETRRALIWGAALPGLAILLAVTVSPFALLLLGLWGVKILRLISKGYDGAHAWFLTLGNVAEAQGALQFYLKKWRGGPTELIEYK